jgi:hypothetical protein
MFERDFYQKQDLNWDQHWWDIVERIQFIPRPETYRAPDWAVSTWLGVIPNSSLVYLCGVLLSMQLKESVEEDLFTPLTVQTVKKLAPVIPNKLYPSFEEEEMKQTIFHHWPKPIPKPASRPRRAPAK